jgi:hypothetical protein
MALIHEMKAASLGMSSSADSPSTSFSQQQQQSSQGTATEMFLTSMARQNLHALLKAVMQMEVYWAGVTYVASLLEQRELDGCIYSRELTVRRLGLCANAPSAWSEADVHLAAR